jgi:hypothetical protein
LFIRGEPEQLAATAESICNSLPFGNWSRDLEAEERSRQAASPEWKHVYSFWCKKPERLTGANLFLKDLNTNTLEVTNIVPRKEGQLSYREFNEILEEFFKLFVQPAVTKTGAEAELTEAEVDLERWLSPETAKKLREFCFLSPTGARSNYPEERRRLWRDFIISAHREGADLDSTTLARWLHEDGHLVEERADILAGEYASGRALLAQVDRQAVGV